jgi:hypothetical protein
MLDMVFSEDILIGISESQHKIDRVRPDSELIESWILTLYPSDEFDSKSHIARVVDNREEYVDGGWLIMLNLVFHEYCVSISPTFHFCFFLFVSFDILSM